MSEVLGHDIDGKPLRAGDRVLLIETKGPVEPGAMAAVLRAMTQGEMLHFVGEIVIRHEGANYACESHRLRKIDPKSDHQPADEEFTKWLKGMSVGVTA